MDLPADINILVSLVNTRLRDEYRSLAEMCEEEGVDRDALVSRLASAGYFYDEKNNRFGERT